MADIFWATLLPSEIGPPTLSQVCIITNTSSTPIPIIEKYLANYFENLKKILSSLPGVYFFKVNNGRSGQCVKHVQS